MVTKPEDAGEVSDQKTEENMCRQPAEGAVRQLGMLGQLARNVDAKSEDALDSGNRSFSFRAKLNAGATVVGVVAIAAAAVVIARCPGSVATVLGALR